MNKNERYLFEMKMSDQLSTGLGVTGIQSQKWVGVYGSDVAADAGESAGASEEMSAQAEQMQAFTGEPVKMVSGNSYRGNSRPAGRKSGKKRMLPVFLDQRRSM